MQELFHSISYLIHHIVQDELIPYICMVRTTSLGLEFSDKVVFQFECTKFEIRVSNGLRIVSGIP